MKNIYTITSAAVLMSLAGCKTLETVTNIGTSLGVATGAISAQQAESINKTSGAVGKTFESITPEQEYYIGRAVAATILKTYKPLDNPDLNNYLNTIGQILAAASDKPETFGGYHFLALNTDEINAFAAPGGLIFVSRGLLRCCKTEDAVAAVLAHEVGHVQHGHGLQAIKKSRLTSALTILAAEGAKNFGGDQLAELTTAFEGSISDITATMVNSGYARTSESQSDQAAVTILKKVGYNPVALKSMLQEMDKLSHPGQGFAKTHPAPADRINDIQNLLNESYHVTEPRDRIGRFNNTISSL